jgi:hypothetical protein
MSSIRVRNVLGAVVVLALCVESTVGQGLATKKRLSFLSMIQEVTHSGPGNEGAILQSHEARYREAGLGRSQPLASKALRAAAARYALTFNAEYDGASYKKYFLSDDVGGILLRNEPNDTSKMLKLDSLTFQLDETQSSKPARVNINLAANNEKVACSVDASIVFLAARMAADERDRLVLLTMAAGSGKPRPQQIRDMLAIHPAIAGHQFVMAAALVDDSLMLRRVPGATHYILSEAEWSLNASAFSDEHHQFTLAGRLGTKKISSPTLTQEWFAKLDMSQRSAAEKLNEFIIVYRLINAAVEGYLEDFPEKDFAAFLAKIEPHYRAQAMTGAQEVQFSTWLDQTELRQLKRLLEQPGQLEEN